MRLVLDTWVLVSAFRNREGASFRLGELMEHGRSIAVATPMLLFEYEAVLMRPSQRQVHKLTELALEEAICGLVDTMEAVRVDFRWKPMLRDPDDEMVLEAATNGHAEAIGLYQRCRLSSRLSGIEF